MAVRALCLTAGLLAGIASTGLAQTERKPARDRNVITQEEIQKAGSKTTTQLVRKLRPMWLSSRGAAGLTTPDPAGNATYANREQAVAVYVDGVRRGSAQELDDIPLEQIGELRYFSGDQATNRFGMGNELGAIEVITKK